MLLAMGLTSHCQYSWWNQLYIQPPNIVSGVIRLNVHGDTINAIGGGGWWDQNDLFHLGLTGKKINNFTGEVIFDQFVESDVPIESIIPESITMPGGEKLFLATYENESGCNSPTIIIVDSNFHKISQKILPGFNDCFPFGEIDYYLDMLYAINETEYMVTLRVFNDGTNYAGHHYFKLNLNGVLIDDWYIEEPLPTNSHVQLQIYNIPNDSIIIFNMAGQNFTGVGPSLQKADEQGNVTNEVFIGQGDYYWAEDTGNGLIKEDTLVILRHKTTFADFNGNYISVIPIIQKYSVHSLELLQEQEFPFPEIVDTTLQHYKNVKLLRAHNGGYIGVVLGGNYVGNTTGTFVIAFKTDENLNLEWNQIYYPPNTDNNLNAFCQDASRTTDGGYAILGSTESSGQPYWLIKTDACGYAEPSNCPPLVSVKESEKVEIKVWPNPVENILQAQLPPHSRRASLLDITGRVLWSEAVYYSTQEWNVAALAYGIYFLEVEMEGGQKLVVKVVKR
jgi:hypothetical protein